MKKTLCALLAVLIAITGMSMLQTSALSSVLTGDLDGDGQLTSSDLNLMSLFMNGKAHLDAVRAFAADFNGDYTVDQTDYDELNRIIKGGGSDDKRIEVSTVLKHVGDLDDDGVVSISDATKLQRYLAELEELSNVRISLADTTGDYDTNVTDVTEIQRLIAEMTDHLGVNDVIAALPEDPTVPQEKGKVYYLNSRPELEETIQYLAELYTDTTGVEVKVVTPDYGEYDNTLKSEIKRSDPPTIFNIGNSEGVKAWGSYALDLNGTAIANELTTDAFNLTDKNGKLVSIPYCYECFGIIVNPDLVKKAGFKMEDIKNFDGLKKVAESIHANAKKLGFDAFSACDMDDISSWRFTGHMANLEYFYEEREAGTKWTECPSSITGNYMNNYKNLYDLCINNSTVDPKSLAWGGHDSEYEFTSRKAAFFVNGSWEYGWVSEYVPNATMIPYYCGVAGEEKAGLNCGTESCWAVNAKISKADQKAAIDFLVWLASDPEASKEMVNYLGVMPFRNAPQPSNGFLNDANRYIADGCYVMDWAMSFQPNVYEYRQNIVTALNAYNSNQTGTNWYKVKKAFVDGWAVQYAAQYG